MHTYGQLCWNVRAEEGLGRSEVAPSALRDREQAVQAKPELLNFSGLDQPSSSCKYREQILLKWEWKGNRGNGGSLVLEGLKLKAGTAGWLLPLQGCLLVKQHCDSDWQQLAWELLGVLGGKIEIDYLISAFSCSLKVFQDWSYAICLFSVREQPRGFLASFYLCQWTYLLLTSLVFGSHMKSQSFQPCIARLCSLSCETSCWQTVLCTFMEGEFQILFFFLQQF